MKSVSVISAVCRAIVGRFLPAADARVLRAHEARVEERLRSAEALRADRERAPVRELELRRLRRLLVRVPAGGGVGERPAGTETSREERVKCSQSAQVRLKHSSKLQIVLKCPKHSKKSTLGDVSF